MNFSDIPEPYLEWIEIILVSFILGSAILA